CPLADLAAVDIHRHLEAALRQRDDAVEDAEPDQRPKHLLADRLVDDPTLQLERDEVEQKDGRGQCSEPDLCAAADVPNIAIKAFAAGPPMRPGTLRLPGQRSSFGSRKSARFRAKSPRERASPEDRSGQAVSAQPRYAQAM